jgi:[ribosomal protein S5]-alanine N-acetyltransferase
MQNKFPLIRTERLLLRQFTDADLENVFKGLSHPDVIPYYGISFDSLEATKEQMAWYAELERTGTGIWWAICSPDNTAFYGAAGFNNLAEQHKKAEIGFWLLPEYWSKGIITETIPLICSYAFRELGLHRIESQVETENTNSKKVMAKLRFRHEGTMQDCEFKNGRFISLEIYALLSTDKLMK